MQSENKQATRETALHKLLWDTIILNNKRASIMRKVNLWEEMKRGRERGRPEVKRAKKSYGNLVRAPMDSSWSRWEDSRQTPRFTGVTEKGLSKKAYAKGNLSARMQLLLLKRANPKR